MKPDSDNRPSGSDWNDPASKFSVYLGLGALVAMIILGIIAVISALNS